MSFGGYEFSHGPDEPIVVHMERFASKRDAGLAPREQHRVGRHELLRTSFETMEREIRSQLGGMLAGGGFDPARDIAAITVNRWAHGYASWPNQFADPRLRGWSVSPRDRTSALWSDRDRQFRCSESVRSSMPRSIRRTAPSAS